MADTAELSDPSNPIYSIELETEIFLIILIYSLGILSLSFLAKSLRNTVKAWNENPRLTSLSFLQVLLGTYWTKSFLESEYPDLRPSHTNLSWALRIFVFAFLLFSIYYLIGKEFFDALFGLGPDDA